MLRRYHANPPEFQVSNVLSTVGATVPGIRFMMRVLYLDWSLKCGAIAGNNPWQATGLERQIQSPPLTENFKQTPIMDHEAYAYGRLEKRQAEAAPANPIRTGGQQSQTRR